MLNINQVFELQFCYYACFVRRISYNALMKRWTLYCTMPWLLRDLSKRYGDVSLDEGPKLFLIWPPFHYKIFYNARSHKKGHYCRNDCM